MKKSKSEGEAAMNGDDTPANRPEDETPAGSEINPTPDSPTPPPEPITETPILTNNPISLLVDRSRIAYPGLNVPIAAIPFPDFGTLIDDDDQPPEVTDFELGEPPPELLQPPAVGDLPPRRPSGWPAEPIPETDPVPNGEILQGQNPAALFVSDFHLSDGGVGDDFLVNHLVPMGGIVVGNPKAAVSRSGLFAAVAGFVLARARGLGINSVDFVLNGDTIDGLELIGRGSAIDPAHNGFFGTIAALRAAGNPVFYLRGNHDFVVPPGPWTPGVVYANAALTTLAEHGDFWDPFNWPPGPRNPGSVLVISVTASLEVLVTEVTLTLTSVYELAGLDNVRPFSAGELAAFLQRRVGIVSRILFPNAAALIDLATIAIKAFGGMPDDFGGLGGALVRRIIPRFGGWLQVQGHTHVPVAIPGVYYNTGTWTPYVRLAGQAERILERYPFLFVYLDPNTGARVEEYFIVEFRGGRPVAVLSNRARVNRLRRSLGYRAF